MEFAMLTKEYVHLKQLFAKKDYSVVCDCAEEETYDPTTQEESWEKECSCKPENARFKMFKKIAKLKKKLKKLRVDYEDFLIKRS